MCCNSIPSLAREDIYSWLLILFFFNNLWPGKEEAVLFFSWYPEDSIFPWISVLHSYKYFLLNKPTSETSYPHDHNI